MGIVLDYKWAPPYLNTEPTGMEREEDCVLNYFSLSAGHLNNDPSTVANHLKAIGHFNKIKLWRNPSSAMARAQLMVRGMMKEKGPTARKLPFLAEYFRDLKSILNMELVDQRLVWRTALSA